MDGINFILKHNVFEFKGQLYIQTKGTAMVTRFALAFANLYMGLFEDRHIMNENSWNKNIITYRRYIDDLLFIWEGTEDTFKAFMTYLNKNQWGLFFSGTVSEAQIDYLDITISSEGSRVITKNFFKMCDSNNHHRKWLRNIPFGQLRRVRRNCTKIEDFKIQSRNLMDRFRDKHYPKTIIQAAYDRAAVLTQEQCILPKKHVNENQTLLFQQAFITTFSQDHNKINKILTNNCHILRSDPYLQTILPSKPQIIYWRAKALVSKLAPSKFNSKKN